MEDQNTTVSMESEGTNDTTARDVVPADLAAPADLVVADPGAPSHASSERYTDDARRAYAAMLPRALALPPKLLRAVNVEPMQAGAECRAIADRVAPLRAELAALPGFDITALDELEMVGRALMVAHVEYKVTLAPRTNLAELVAEGNALRDRVQVWAEPLARDGLLDPRVCTELRRTTTSHHDLAIALHAWASHLRNHPNWARIQRTSALDDATMLEAMGLADSIMTAIAVRDIDPVAVQRVTDIRTRMFSLAMQHHCEVRCGVTYLRRHHGDADRLAPSLYRKTNKRGAKPSQGADAQTPMVQPAAHVDEVGHPNSNPFLKR